MLKTPKVHICGERGCRAVIPMNERYCKTHKPQHQYNYKRNNFTQEQKKRANKHYNLYERDQEANSFYHSRAWTKVANYVRNRDMMTSGATGKPLSDHHVIVDHITPRKYLTREEALNTENLWLLSRKEHNIKTKIEESIANSPNGVNKLKHLSREWWSKVIKERINK